eukprot:2245042-Prymnesium_polylepis.1
MRAPATLGNCSLAAPARRGRVQIGRGLQLPPGREGPRRSRERRCWRRCWLARLRACRRHP